MTRRTRRVLALVAATAMVLFGGGSAFAAWSSLAHGEGAASSGTMPAGPAATAAPAGDDVVVTWDDVTLAGGGASDYVIKRYDGSGAATTPNTDCDGVISTSECTETAVPEGSWTYRVATAKRTWRGTQGTASSPVRIATFAPTELAQAAGATRTSVTLNWTEASKIEDGYRIQRSNDGTTGWTDLGTVLAANSTSYSDATLTCGTTKSYRVKATDAANGDSAYSNVATATSAACPQAQATPTALTATAASATRVDLAWTDNASSETGYRVQSSPDGAEWTTLTSSLAPNASTFSDTSLSCGTTRHYRVQALGDADSAYSNVDDATTNACLQPPSAPTSLAASAASGTQINLTWTDNSNNETGFRITRTNGSTTVNIPVPAADGTGTRSHQDAVSCGTSYSYQVLATNSAGDSAYSNTAQVTSTVCAPAAPTNLTATPTTVAGGGVRVALQWTDNASDESGFEIERTATGKPTVILTRGSSSANPTTHTDTSPACGTTYTYKVRATNAGGASVYSATATAETVACTAMYISAIPTSTSGSNNWRAIAAPAVKDHLGGGVAVATVAGTWTWTEGTTAKSASGTCVTSATGECALTNNGGIGSGNIASNGTSVTFTVTGVTAASRTYAPSSNVTTTASVVRPY